jgi:hypothetical protein
MSALTLPLVLVSLSAGPLQFSGTASVYSEYGWVWGDSLVEPRPELRFNVNPSLSLWGFPIGLNMLVSTQENPLRQQLDKFRLFLDPKKWLESQTNLSGLALSFKGLELGSCNPSWTPLTLARAPVFGGAVELNPWYVYAAAAAGRNQRRVDVSDSTQGAYARMLYSGRFGFGKKEGTHFYLTALYAADDSIPPANNWQPNPNDTVPPIDSFEVVKPQENYVVGAEFNLDLLDGAVRLESEVAGCEVTRDNRFAVEHWDWLPGWLTKTFKPRMTSSVDYSFKVRPVLKVLDTRLYGQLEMVGPGFQSFGASGLRNDNYSLGAGIERSFFKNAVALSVRYSTEHDNLLRQAVEWVDTTYGLNGETIPITRHGVLTSKPRTTRFSRWEASLGLIIPNLPYLQAGYYPYEQLSDSLDSQANVVATEQTLGRVVSVSAGHSFQTGKLSHSPSASFSYSDVRGPALDNADNTNWDASLSYGVGFEFPLSVSATGGYGRSVAARSEPDSRLYVSLTPSYTLFEKWTHSLSLGGTFGSATRVDIRYSTAFPVWKICDGRVGIADAVYSGDDGSYNDLRLTAELSRSW